MLSIVMDRCASVGSQQQPYLSSAGYRKVIIISSHKLLLYMNGKASLFVLKCFPTLAKTLPTNVIYSSITTMKTNSLNRHASWSLRMRQVGHLCVIHLLVHSNVPPCQQIWLQAFTKVHHALDGINDGSHKEKNCYDGKNCKLFANRSIVGDFVAIVDPYKLENEVDKSCYVKELNPVNSGQVSVGRYLPQRMPYPLYFLCLPNNPREAEWIL